MKPVSEQQSGVRLLTAEVLFIPVLVGSAFIFLSELRYLITLEKAPNALKLP